MANLSQLKENWFIIAFIAGMIIWYANTNSRLNAVEAQQVEQKTAIEQVVEIKSDISGIKSDVGNIKADIQFIKNRI